MKLKITESQSKLLQEKLMLKNWKDYVDLVATAYDEAPDYEPSAVSHWAALNKSNYEWFNKITKKVNLIFVSGDKKYENNPSTINIAGKQYPLEYYPGGQPYNTQPEMKHDYDKNHRLYISVDYSEHPYFSVVDNIVFRTVHDLLTHLYGNYSFEFGELNSYNLHARLAPPSAVPALFTEVVGQAATVLARGGFPKQKIAVLKGFDYYKVGMVDDYEIQNKELVKNKDKEVEPEMELSEEILDEGKQVGIIAHYTPFNSIVKILETNTLKSSRGYVSFTRDLTNKHLKGFGDFRIIIDGNKLSNKYKVEPFMYNFARSENGFDRNAHKQKAKEINQSDIRDLVGHEREEMVVGEINNIKDYIIRIEFPKEWMNFPKLKMDIKSLIEKYNIEFVPLEGLSDAPNEVKFQGYIGRPNLNENKNMKKIKITESQLHRLLESELKECSCSDEKDKDEITETVDPNLEGDVVIPNNNANTQVIKKYTDQGINVKLVDNNGLPTAS